MVFKTGSPLNSQLEVVSGPDNTVLGLLVSAHSGEVSLDHFDRFLLVIKYLTYVSPSLTCTSGHPPH